MQHHSTSYYPHINLLRAFAALTVLVYHVIELGEWTDFPITYPLLWFRTGWMAVDLFLVISGFVITLSLLQWQERGLGYRQTILAFMKQRWWRIAPLYLLTGFCYILAVAPYLWDHPKYILTFLTFTQNLHLSLGGDSINGICWSVVLEMQFYLFLVLTLPWWSTRPLWKILITLLLVAIAARSLVWEIAEQRQWPVYERFFYAVKLPCVLDEFAMGICLALWVRQENRKLLPGIIFALLIAVAIPIFKIYWENASYWHIEGMLRFWRSSLGLFFGLVLALAVAIPYAIKPALPYRIFYYLGEISYGIYLWHLTIIMTLKNLFHLQGSVLLMATLAAVLPLAALSWHTIEKPCIRYGKKIR